MAEDTTITANRKAWHDYFIDETFEAGIVLAGTEVKSLRAGRANLVDAYVMIKDGEAFLVHAHISPYDEGSFFNHDARRTRKLLLHRAEIRRLNVKTKDKGFTIVPLKMYFKRGRAKVEIALARGKKSYDKRDSIAARDARREIERGVRQRFAS